MRLSFSTLDSSPYVSAFGPRRRAELFAIVGLALGSVTLRAQVEVLAIPNPNPNFSVSALGSRSLGAAGDVNGDGVFDILFSSPTGVFVFSGSTGANLLMLDDGVSPAPSTAWGYARGIALGDVNGDDRADIGVAVGSDVTTAYGSGTVRIYSGLDGAILCAWLGPEGHFVGTSIHGLGDVDLDGFPDAVLGAIPNPEAPKALSPMQALVVGPFSASSPILSAASDVASVTSSLATSIVAAAGDTNLDGVPDYMVQFASSTSSSAPVAIRDGKTGEFLRYVKKPSDNYFGREFGAGPDLDFDGIADLFATTPTTGKPAKHRGSLVEMFSGATGKLIVARDSTSPFGGFGDSVVTAGDLDGDAHDDLVIGEPYSPTITGKDTGMVRLFANPGSQELFPRLQGSEAGSVLGRSIAALGDLNGDGIQDIAVTDNGAAGAIRVLAIDVHATEPINFRPGSTIRGTIDSTDDLDAIRLQAIEGQSLKVRLDSASPGSSLRVDLLSELGSIVASGKYSKPGQVHEFEVNGSGEYVMRVRSPHSTGEYSFSTNAKAPKKARSQKLKFTKTGTVERRFSARSGTFVDIEVEGHKNTASPPTIRLTSESGATIAIAPHLDTLATDGAITRYRQVPLPETGEYVMEVEALSEQAKTVVTIALIPYWMVGQENLAIEGS